jgi:ribosomal protein L11 methyltransferase
MLELFPDGFEEVDTTDGVELVAYTDPGGEERLMHAFTIARGADVDAGWEERWREFHKSVRVGRLWVGPPWETAPADTLAVTIDPGRAFGTGGHATTRLCLELLQESELGSLVDIGCGSGVLSIAAVKLGFAPVVALDVDPAAIEATRANAAVNGAEVEARLTDATAERLPSADVGVANIALDAVLALAPRVDVETLITSGYLMTEEPSLAGYAHADRRERDGWAADLFARKRR